MLSSQFGTRGLRDPFLIRSHEGDRFWLLATDLKAYPEVDFGEAQETGSKYLEVWESTDLVNWSAQRHIKVSSDFAGNTWAPEAFYDEEAGEYVVYWASALYPTTDTTGRDIATSYQRMMYVTTRDFMTFSEPQPWIDVRRGPGRGIIDVTVVKDGDTYQRVLKDEASMTPRQEASTDLRATVSGSLPTTTSSPGWRLVKERIGSGQPNPWGGTFSQGEGPTIFPDNEVPGRWYLFIDQPSYHGGRGYVAFRTDNLAAADWQSVPTAELPSEPRHGTVIPVTQEELDRLRETYQPELLVESVDDVAVSTRQGIAPELPATVPALLGDGTTDDVAVRWDDVPPSDYAAPGTFTVQGTVVSGSADRPVATVRVGDSLDPVVSLSDHDGWSTTDPVTVSVSATDETGVDSLETAVDDEEFDVTEGDEADVEVTGDGVHTVRARAVDDTGNRSEVVETTVRIDATNPVSRADVTGTGEGRQVVVRAADATSGVDRVEVRPDGETEWQTYDGPLPVGAGATTVSYRAVDVAGNLETTRTLTVPAAQGPPLPTSLVASAPARVRHGRPFGVSVRVTGPEGPVAGVVRVFDGGREVGRARLVDGRRVVRVARLPLGRQVLAVRYDGSARYRPDRDFVVVRVTRR